MSLPNQSNHATLYAVLYTLHCTLHAVHCTLYTVHCQVYTVPARQHGSSDRGVLVCGSGATYQGQAWRTLSLYAQTMRAEAGGELQQLLSSCDEQAQLQVRMRLPVNVMQHLRVLCGMTLTVRPTLQQQTGSAPPRLLLGRIDVAAQTPAVRLRPACL